MSGEKNGTKYSTFRSENLPGIVLGVKKAKLTKELSTGTSQTVHSANTAGTLVLLISSQR